MVGMRYRYEDLGDEEFQQLIQALLATSLGATMQAMPLGKADGGRDALHGTAVYQVKFASAPDKVRDPVAWLLAAFDKEEKKIRLLVKRGVRNYFLVTNLGGTGNLGTGTIDRLNRELAERARDLSIQITPWWRETLDAQMSAAPDLAVRPFLRALPPDQVLALTQRSAAGVPVELKDRVIVVSVVPDGAEVPGRSAPTWSAGAIFEPPRPERNPYFVGRVETLDQLDVTLRPETPTALRQAMTGLGGVGKTELAIEYAHRRRRLYDVVYTLRAATPATVVGDMRRLAGKLGLSKAPNGLATRVLEWLATHDRWLVIFDNADDPDVVRSYLPRGGGHVVITSRARDWGPLVGVVDVDVWRPDESVEFLRKRLNRTDAADARAAAQVAELLGHLPLALEQAASYMRQRGTPYVDYIRLLESRTDRLLAEGAPTDLGYDRTVMTTWIVTIEEIRKLRPAAVDLLQLCAFLAPEAIPESLFNDGASILPAPLRRAAADVEELQETWGILDRFSLVKRARGLVSVHRLVQQVIRTSLTEPERRAVISTSVRILDHGFPGPALPDSHDSRRSALLPHVLAIFPHAAAANGDPELAHHVLMRAGEYMARQAQLEGAPSSLDHAHAIATQTYGHDSPQVAHGLAVLGEALYRQADLAGARACFERALAIAEPIYGAAHPDTIGLLNSLAGVLREMGDLAGARSYLARALSSHPANGRTDGRGA
jgi:tetratricopeptide (TPR) repeat protein